MSNNENINCSFSKIPFKTRLSFEYLIVELENISISDNHPMRLMAKDFMQKLDAVPALKKPGLKRSVIEENQMLVNQMMAFVFNPLNDNIDVAIASPPFDFEPFYSTPLYDDLIKGDYRKLEMAKEMDNDKTLISILYHAYLIILEKIYDFRIDIEMPFTFKLNDERDKTVKYFKKRVNSRYLKVKPVGKINKLSTDDIKELFDKSYDLNFWNKKIHLQNFEFSGFLRFDYINITHDYVISQLKSDLLDRDTIISQEGFLRIREKIRALIEIPDVEFGLAASNDFESSLNRNFIWKTIIPQSQLKCEEYMGTIYEKAFLEKRVVLTNDFKSLEKNKVVSVFLKKGIRSHAVVPLILEEEIVGMLEFGSKNPGELSMLQIKRLYELFPIFALALKRSKEEWNNKVRAIIQEEFTAIHPTVEWRFREAVAKLIDENANGETTGIEPIIFSEVVPVYGASDIRGSSVERNFAIQADLTEQLKMAKNILENSSHSIEMPLLDDLGFKIGKHLETVGAVLKAGDEVSIIEFMKREIDPVLRLLKDRFNEMKKPVDTYFNKLDPELGVLYKKRKDFEKSLTKINDKVSKIIDEEQLKAQNVFPHYFEKYRTDGVEYNAYIGQSLVKDLEYSDIYLKNIRLWQLLVKVKIARKIKSLQPDLKTKLDITQLILVHSNPLSITFRQDEKKFDVAGAYNIRYEITKKRIDKAMINGTNERVTQVGKIAIIYSYSDEIKEYRKYINYMISKGFLTDSVEEIELENLTGASGLKALRVEVNFNDPVPDEISMEQIEEVVSQ